MQLPTASMDREAIDRNCIKEYTKEFVEKCGLNRKSARAVAHQIVEKKPVPEIQQTLRNSGVEDIEGMFVKLIDAMENAQLYDGTKNEPGHETAESLADMQQESSPGNKEVVMLSKVQFKKSTKSGKGKKAPGRQAPTTEAHARGHQALHPAETLGMAMGQLERLPKPRSMKHKGIDEVIWSGALDTAQKEMATEFQVKSVDEYYSSMCRVGKMLLASEVQRRTQKVYDYRASKKQSRQIRKEMRLQNTS